MFGSQNFVSQVTYSKTTGATVVLLPGTADYVLWYAKSVEHDKYRRLVRKRGITPLIARRQTEHGSGLGRERWVVERTFAWLHNRRRLLLRTDRRHETQEAFLDLACCLICWRRVETSFS